MTLVLTPRSLGYELLNGFHRMDDLLALLWIICLLDIRMWVACFALECDWLALSWIICSHYHGWFARTIMDNWVFCRVFKIEYFLRMNFWQYISSSVCFPPSSHILPFSNWLRSSSLRCLIGCSIDSLSTHTFALFARLTVNYVIILFHSFVMLFFMPFDSLSILWNSHAFSQIRTLICQSCGDLPLSMSYYDVFCARFLDCFFFIFIIVNTYCFNS
jgi:hypothetical protein